VTAITATTFVVDVGELNRAVYLSKDTIAYCVLNMDDDDNYCTLKKTVISANETHELPLGRIFVNGMTFVAESDTILLWADTYSVETDFIMAIDTNLNIKWKTDNLSANVMEVVLSKGKYYAIMKKSESEQQNKAFNVAEIDMDGTIVTMYTNDDYGDFMLGFSAVAHNGDVFLGGGSLIENKVENGIIFLCGRGASFLDEYIMLEKNHLPADGTVKDNVLTVLCHNIENQHLYLDFIDLNQKKTIQTTDTAGIYKKYDLDYLGLFEYEKDRPYIRAVGVMDRESRYNKNRNFFLLYLDNEGRPAKAFAVQSNVDFEVSPHAVFEDAQKIYLISTGARDNNNTVVFEINKADLRFFE
jgi:hypothetical protein